MNIVLDNYTPLISYLSPASIPQIVAHIQDYLLKHPILSVETVAEIIVQSLQEHPELLNGEAIPISADSEQSIKAYIDALPFLDTYTKAEINALLLGKQDTLTFDQAPTPGSSNPVTSSGIIAALSALQSVLETQISAKADSASTYTKTQVDTLLTDKADADNVYSKNTMDAKLLEVNTDIDNLEDALSDQSQQIDDLGPLNVLTSDSVIAALSAAQGKALKGLIDDVVTDVDFKNQIDTSGGVVIQKAIRRNNVVTIIGTAPPISTPNTFTIIGSVPNPYYNIFGPIIGNLSFATTTDLGNGVITISTTGNISVFYDKVTTYGLPFSFTYVL